MDPEKISKYSRDEFEALTTDWREAAAITTTRFKQFSAECLKASIDMQPLIKLLLTTFGVNRHEKIISQMAIDVTWRTPEMKHRATLIDLLNSLQERQSTIEWILRESYVTSNAETAHLSSSG